MLYQVLIKWRVSVTNIFIKFLFNQTVSGIIYHVGNKYHVGDLMADGKVIRKTKLLEKLAVRM
jgi:hypothetical protein